MSTEHETDEERDSFFEETDDAKLVDDDEDEDEDDTEEEESEQTEVVMDSRRGGEMGYEDVKHSAGEERDSFFEKTGNAKLVDANEVGDADSKDGMSDEERKEDR